jgi:hypothetical protein
LVALVEPQHILARFRFEGKLRAACVTESRVLLLNEKGRLWMYPRPEP